MRDNGNRRECLLKTKDDCLSIKGMTINVFEITFTLVETNINSTDPEVKKEDVFGGRSDGVLMENGCKNRYLRKESLL